MELKIGKKVWYNYRQCVVLWFDNKKALIKFFDFKTHGGPEKIHVPINALTERPNRHEVPKENPEMPCPNCEYPLFLDKCPSCGYEVGFKEWLENHLPTLNQDNLSYQTSKYKINYKINKQVPPYWIEQTNMIIHSIKRELLPQLNLFKEITVHWVDCNNRMGRYVVGTSTSPIIMLDYNACSTAADKYNLPLDLCIETTILHELGHAIQETLGISKNEKEAENFAKSYYELGNIIKFRKKPKKWLENLSDISNMSRANFDPENNWKNKQPPKQIGYEDFGHHTNTPILWNYEDGKLNIIAGNSGTTHYDQGMSGVFIGRVDLKKETITISCNQRHNNRYLMLELPHLSKELKEKYPNFKQLVFGIKYFPKGTPIDAILNKE